MAAYSSLVKEVLPYVPLCPDSLVEQNLRYGGVKTVFEEDLNH